MKQQELFRRIPVLSLLLAQRRSSQGELPLPVDKHWRAVPSFNLAPEAFSTRRLAYPVLILIVVFIGGLMILPLYQEKEALDSAIQGVRNQLSVLEKREKAATAIKGEAQGLQDAATLLKEQNQALEAFRRDASAIVTATVGILRSKPAKVKLTSIGQSKGELLVEGEAADYDVLVQYRNQVQTLPAVARIASFTSRESKTSILFSWVVQVRGKE